MIRKLLAGVLVACMLGGVCPSVLAEVPEGATTWHKSNFDGWNGSDGASMSVASTKSDNLSNLGSWGDKMGSGNGNANLTRKIAGGLGGKADTDYSYIIEKPAGVLRSSTESWPQEVLHLNGNNGIELGANDVWTLEMAIYMGDFYYARNISLVLAQGGTAVEFIRIATDGAITAFNGGAYPIVGRAAMNTWYHFAFVIYGNSNNYDLYINKIKINRDATYTHTGPPNSMKINNFRIQFTNLPDVENDHYLTGIDDIYIYNSAPEYANNDVAFTYKRNFNSQIPGGTANFEGDPGYEAIGMSSLYQNDNFPVGFNKTYEGSLGDKTAGDLAYRIEKLATQSLGTEYQTWPRVMVSSGGIVMETGSVFTCEASMYFGEFELERNIEVNSDGGSGTKRLLTIKKDKKIYAKRGGTDIEIGEVEINKWYDFAFVIYVGSNNYDVYINRKQAVNGGAFSQDVTATQFKEFRYLVNLPGTGLDNVTFLTAIDDIAIYSGQPDYATAEAEFEFEFEPVQDQKVKATATVDNYSNQEIKGIVILAGFNNQDQLVNVSIGGVVTIGAKSSRNDIQSGEMLLGDAKYVKAFFWKGEDKTLAIEGMNALFTDQCNVNELDQ